MLEELRRLANSPKRDDQEKLRNYLADNPEILHQLGDIRRSAELAIHRLASNKCPAMTAAMRMHAENLRESLLSEESSQWERQCVAHAVLCLEACQTLQSRIYSDFASAIDSQLHRALDMADKQFLMALKAVQLAQQMSRAAHARPLQVFNPGGRRTG